MSASLSTHVLDTERGRPAPGIRVELLEDGELVAEHQTDDDGRIADFAPGLKPGLYSLVFFPPSPFFRRVQFDVELAEGHTHVPLLVSSYACVSYRGS